MGQRRDYPDQARTAPTSPEGLGGVTSRADEKDVLVEALDLEDAENVTYWCDRWQVSPDELREVVEHCGGNDAPSVSFALGLESP